MASGSGSGSNSSYYIPEASTSSASGSSVGNKLNSISSSSSSNANLVKLVDWSGTSSKSRTRSSNDNSTSSTINSTSNSKGKGKGKSSITSTTFDRNCEAIDRWEDECTNLVSSSNGKGKVTRNWCSVHDSEEKVLRSEFSKYIEEISSFEHPITILTSKVNGSDDLDELEGWELMIREKLDLVDQTLLTFSYHSSHFSSANSLSTENLTIRQIEEFQESLNSSLKIIIKRSHSLILESEEANWIKPIDTHSHPPCNSVPASTASTSPIRTPCVPLLQPEDEEPNPVTAITQMRRAELLEIFSLSGSHATFIRDSGKSIERIRIIECLFRRLISRDEELLVKAYRSGQNHVLRFFEDTTCCSLSAITRLHKALQTTSILSIREAVLDAFRAIKWEESGDTNDTEDGEEGQGLQLLGGWTYKLGFLKREMTTREWEHVYDLCACPGCAIRICSTFTEWCKIRRLTVISHGKNPPPFFQWGDSKESDACKIFKALDIIKCSEERSGSESEVRKVGGQFIGVKGKGLFVERQERNWIFLKMSTSHPKAVPIINALKKSHVVLVRSQLTPTTPIEAFPIPPSSHLWYSRHRSAPSKADLRHLSFQTNPDEFGPSNSDPLLILQSLDNLDSPEKSQGLKIFKNTFEILVMDGFGREGEGTGLTAATYVLRSTEQFENEVSQLVLEGVEISDVKKAIEWGEAESYRKGDLLFDFGRKLTLSDKKKDISTVEKAIRLIGEGGGLNSLMSTKGGNVGSSGAKKKEKVVEGAAAILESLRDDALAFRLSRSLFR